MWDYGRRTDDYRQIAREGLNVLIRATILAILIGLLAYGVLPK